MSMTFSPMGRPGCPHKKKKEEERNRSNQLKLDTNKRWMDRMYKLRRNFTIK